MSHTLHLRDLSKRFGSTVALHPLTLSFPGGRFTSILGPSGCGKSTLLRLISGLERPSGGRIFVDDTDITDIPPVRRKIGMVFQQYALFPNLTVAENVLYGLHGKDASGTPLWSSDARRERMREMLALVGLEAFAERRPHVLMNSRAVSNNASPSHAHLRRIQAFCFSTNRSRHSTPGVVRQSAKNCGRFSEKAA